MLDANWAQLGGTIFLGLIGLWLAYNYRRQVRLKLADRQVDAYMALWKITSIAAHTRTTPLDQAEQQKLYNEMTRWYHDDANGIFVSVRTRNLFLAYQHNLICSINDMEPGILADQLSGMSIVDAERRRGCINYRHANLLRNQLKDDLVLHSGFVIYYKTVLTTELSLGTVAYHGRVIRGVRIVSAGAMPGRVYACAECVLHSFAVA